MGRILFDESTWPIVVIRYPHVIDAEDWDKHMETVTGYVLRDRPWGMINDSRSSGGPTSKQRQGIIRMYDAHDALIRKNWRATAIITDSKVIVGVITALTWLRPPSHPFRPFSDYAEGARWVEKSFRPGELPAGTVRVA
jgi:hypothetical protein